MSGGGSAPAQPSTTTQVQDIPAWEQGYVTDLLGRAQAISNQPYQQFSGPQVAGFTPDQLQSFSNIENLGNQTNPTTQSGLDSANAGASTAGNIYNAGAGDINSSTSYNPLAAVAPYLGSAAGYNSAAAGQPWLNQAAGYQNAAAQAGSPQGIQSYMSPYTNDVVNGIQNEANQNWNQNIMPGVNDKFVGSGQYGSGRNAQVLGQAAGNFQTGLSANVANALQSGYGMAGTQAANQASLLSGLGAQSLTGANTAGNLQNQQIGNLLNQAQAAGTATNQEASNLQNAGTALGNLTATQGAQQLSAGTTLGNLGAQQEQTGLEQNQALQAVGQQQQQLNQTNLNTAMQNFQNQVNYPAQQTEYLNQIIRGLPAPTATTSGSQTTPAYSVSPLSGIGGAGVGALALTGSNGNPLGTATGLKKGGLVKGYAEGGVVTTGDDDEDDLDPTNPLNMDLDTDDSDSTGSNAGTASILDYASNDNLPQSAPSNNLPPQQSQMANPLEQRPDEDDSDSSPNSEAPNGKQYKGPTQADNQQQQLLALARGLLTPSYGGSTAAAFGQGLGNLADVESKQREMMMKQNTMDYTVSQDAKKLALEKEKVEQGKYTPIKDMFGNVTGIMETKTGKLVNVGNTAPTSDGSPSTANDEPSADPQKAAMQILNETGTPFTPVASRQDITGRNAQAKAYRDQANGAKSTVQQLNQLDAQTGKYTPGSFNRKIYNLESSIDLGGKQASARTEADKAATLLANSLATSNVNAKNAGIKTIEFDSKGVPNPDMTDEARTSLIEKNKAIANSQIQRAAISDMYPRMHISNVNAIMDNYEEKNPPVLSSGDANPNWMPYKDWLKAGRPNTAAMAPAAEKSPGNATSAQKSSQKVATQADIAETAQKSGKTIEEVTKAAVAKGYAIQ